jgi:hypothetical protein
MDPGDEVFLQWGPGLHRFRARTWRGRAAKENAHKLDPVVEAQGESLGTVLRSAVSNSRRESRICEKVLVTRVKPQPPELDELVLPEAIRNSDRCSAIFTSRIETLIGQG